MEINTQQIERLLQLHEQQAQLPRKSGNTANDFEALLNGQLANANGANATENLVARDAQSALYSQLVLNNTAAEETADPETAAIQEAFNQASGTLDLWDTYARTLGTSTSKSALRDAYSLLEGIDSRVSQMRANPVMTSDQTLNGLLNELEIMATTEKFKFNRGDYL